MILVNLMTYYLIKIFNALLLKFFEINLNSSISTFPRSSLDLTPLPVQPLRHFFTVNNVGFFCYQDVFYLVSPWLWVLGTCRWGIKIFLQNTLTYLRGSTPPNLKILRCKISCLCRSLQLRLLDMKKKLQNF